MPAYVTMLQITCCAECLFYSTSYHDESLLHCCDRQRDIPSVMVKKAVAEKSAPPGCPLREADLHVRFVETEKDTEAEAESA